MPSNKRWKLIKLMKERGNACAYCGVGTWLPNENFTPNERMATLDHIVPKALGGGGHAGNLVLACYGCNQQRGTMSVEEFIASKRVTPSIRTIPVKADLKHEMDPAVMPGTAIATDEAGRSVEIAFPMGAVPEWATRLKLSMEDYTRLLGATANKID